MPGDDANLVAKLCDVDSGGVSTLITTGLLKASHRRGSAQPEAPQTDEVYEFRIPLFSTSYLVRRGHRLRVSISGSDFPHVWPTQYNPELRIFHGGRRPSAVTIPVVPAAPEELPGPSPRPNLARAAAAMTPRYKIETDVVATAVSVTTEQRSAMRIPAGGMLELDHTASARTYRDHPDQSTVTADTNLKVRVPRLGELEVKTSSWFSHSRTVMNARVVLDGRIVFERSWRK